MNRKRIPFLFFIGLLSVGSVEAHDVVWWENPAGYYPSNSMVLYFGLDDCGDPDYGEIGIVPSANEPCTVQVNLDPTTSPAIHTSFANGFNTGNAVWIYVDVNPFAGPGPVNTVVSGEWHATGSPANAGCTATNPNPFSVQITVKRFTPLKIWLDPRPGMLWLDTGGILSGLRASDSLLGPRYNLGLGSNFTIMADQTMQFYRTTHRLGSAVGGIITDGSGLGQSGISLGLQYGGPNSMTFSDGSFSLYGLPRGTNVIALTKPITFVDSTTGSNRTETVGLNIEVPAVNPTNTFYEMLQFKLALLLVPVPACNCTPWCAIGVGNLNGAQTPVFYAGGALPPKSGPPNCGQVEVTVTPPNGVPYPITPGSSKHQNSGPNPATGTWTVTTTVCGQSKQASITVP